MSADFFQHIYQKLFVKDAVSVKQPFVSEAIVRNSRFLEKYESWKGSDEFNAELELLKTCFQQAHLNGNSAEKGFFLYNSAQANGFYFNQISTIPDPHFVFWLDHFREKVLELDYQLYTSDRRFDEKPKGMECVERHYLKPQLKRDQEAPVNQRYGNVLIEWYSYDGETAYLKLMANVYSDRNYTKPLEFDQFVLHLFEQNIS